MRKVAEHGLRGAHWSVGRLCASGGAAEQAAGDRDVGGGGSVGAVEGKYRTMVRSTTLLISGRWTSLRASDGGRANKECGKIVGRYVV